jgi:hypothetical protein
MSANRFSFLTVSDLPVLITEFLRSPFERIKRPFRLTWSAAIALQILVASLAGALAGTVDNSWAEAGISALVFPIIGLMTAATVTLFLYYYFSLFASTFLEIRRLYSIVIVAHLPFFIIHALSGFLPPLDLIGFAFASALLTVGLVEQFSLPHKTVITLCASLFVAFSALWSLIQIVLSTVG